MILKRVRTWQHSNPSRAQYFVFRRTWGYGFWLQRNWRRQRAQQIAALQRLGIMPCGQEEAPRPTIH